jgi:HSP20 family molecular chaperone IbpA
MTATKLPVRTEERQNDRPTEWRPVENPTPSRSGAVRSPGPKASALDIVDKEKAYEITAELPSMDESSIDVQRFRRHPHDQGREAG